MEGGRSAPDPSKETDNTALLANEIDPFAESWTLVEGWLAEQPHCTAKDLMKRLTVELPDLYPTAAQLRTLQRRVQSWRAEKARMLVLVAMRLHSSDHDDRDTEVSETTISLG